MATDAAPGTRTGVNAPGRAQIGVKTLRTDNWRQSPLIYTAILGFFIVYSLVRIFMNKWYYADSSHLLSAIYSPCISKSCVPGSSDFGQFIPALPTGIPLAIVIFPILGGFRATCYYYRKAGYRSFWLSPQACGVAEPHQKYTGERRFPLIVMNYHRYFFVLASVLLLVNAYDALKSFQGKGNQGGFGMGLGSLILTANVVALGLYSLSCHACRHIVGGRLKHFSKHPLRYRAWTFVSKLNPKHGNFAMISLFTVIASDLYVMSVSANWITDLRIIN